MSLDAQNNEKFTLSAICVALPIRLRKPRDGHEGATRI